MGVCVLLEILIQIIDIVLVTVTCKWWLCLGMWPLHFELGGVVLFCFVFKKNIFPIFAS